jgi:predicted N-acyltransferase
MRCRSVRELPHGFVDALDPPWAYTTTEELARLETFLVPEYFVAVDSGEPAGILPYFLPSRQGSSATLHLGSSWGGLNHFATRGGLAGRAAGRELLLAATALAGRAEVKTVVAPHLVEQQLRHFHEAGLAVSTSAEEPRALLDVRWTAFDEYVAMLPHRRRADIRRERERFLARDPDISEHELDSVAESLAPLLVTVERNHGRRVTTGMMSWYLSSIAEASHRDVTARVLAVDGRPAAFTCLWTTSTSLVVRAWGYDESLVGRDATYFNMTIYEPAVLAPQLGAQQIDLGSGAIASKTRRGAISIPITTARLLRSG